MVLYNDSDNSYMNSCIPILHLFHLFRWYNGLIHLWERLYIPVIRLEKPICSGHVVVVVRHCNVIIVSLVKPPKYISGLLNLFFFFFSLFLSLILLLLLLFFSPPSSFSSFGFERCFYVLFLQTQERKSRQKLFFGVCLNLFASNFHV